MQGPARYAYKQNHMLEVHQGYVAASKADAGGNPRAVRKMKAVKDYGGFVCFICEKSFCRKLCIEEMQEAERQRFGKNSDDPVEICEVCWPEFERKWKALQQ